MPEQDLPQGHDAHESIEAARVYLAELDDCANALVDESRSLHDRAAAIDAAREQLEQDVADFDNAIERARHDVAEKFAALVAHWEGVRQKAENVTARLTKGMDALSAEVSGLQAAAEAATAAVGTSVGPLVAALTDHETRVHDLAGVLNASIAERLIAPLTTVPAAGMQFVDADVTHAVNEQTAEFVQSSADQSQRLDALKQALAQASTDIQGQAHGTAQDVDQARESASRDIVDQFVSGGSDIANRFTKFGDDVVQLVGTLIQGYENLNAVVKSAQDIADQASGALGDVSNALGNLEQTFGEFRL